MCRDNASFEEANLSLIFVLVIIARMHSRFRVKWLENESRNLKLARFLVFQRSELRIYPVLLSSFLPTSTDSLIRDDHDSTSGE